MKIPDSVLVCCYTIDLNDEFRRVYLKSRSMKMHCMDEYERNKRYEAALRRLAEATDVCNSHQSWMLCSYRGKSYEGLAKAVARTQAKIATLTRRYTGNT